MLKKICVLLCLVLCTSCVQQKTDENILREQIGALLKTYQNSVNAIDQPLLKSIIADPFTMQAINKEEYMRQLLTMTLLIDSITYSNIRVENYKILADITITGTQIMKPRVNIPLYKEQIPFLHGTTIIHSVFCFTYEGEQLKLLAEDRKDMQSTYRWGTTPPAITLLPLPTAAKAGSILTVDGSVEKGAGNDVVFIAVDNNLVGSTLMSGLSDKTFSGAFALPTTSNGLAELTVMGFAGTLDLNNPDEAVLQGVQVLKYSIRVQ